MLDRPGVGYRAVFLCSKMMIDTALLHDGVCGVTGFDFPVNGKIPIVDGAVPDVVIAFPMAYKRATVGRQDIPHLFLIFRHYRASLSCRVAWNRSEIGGFVGWLSWISSGAV